MRKIRIIYNDFKTPKRIVGIGLLAGALSALIFHNYILAILLLVCGVFVLAFSSGVELDFDAQVYKEFSKIFYTWYDEPKSLKSYSAIIILRKNGKRFIGIGMTRYSAELAYHEFQVFLTDTTHRKRLYLGNYDTRDLAEQYAIGIAQQTGFPLQSYNPLISKETLNKRR